MAVQTAEEVADCACADVVAIRVALCLNVHTIQPERIMVDYAIVAGATKRSAYIGGRSTINHFEKQVDDQSFEENGWCRENSLGQILRQCYVTAYALPA
jgi:hypothetical protein